MLEGVTSRMMESQAASQPAPALCDGIYRLHKVLERLHSAFKSVSQLLADLTEQRPRKMVLGSKS